MSEESLNLEAAERQSTGEANEQTAEDYVKHLESHLSQVQGELEKTKEELFAYKSRLRYAEAGRDSLQKEVQRLRETMREVVLQMKCERINGTVDMCQKLEQALTSQGAVE